jgi:riboflavin kinase/FMN adenylyltransferase
MNIQKRIFALGFFDGVHLGHQVLLRECVRLAEKTGSEAAAVTFDRHPRSLFSNTPPVLISTLPDRLRLLSAYGISHTRVFPVTQAVMSTPWQDFLEQLIREGGAGFVCGEDFHFGHRGQGSAQLLREFCAERDLPCVIVAQQSIGETRISSTYIRRQIEEGDMATAVRFLGHPLMLTGTVVRGQQLGRTLGIPTANLLLPDGVAAPKFGVYVCRCLIDGERYPAVTNVGTRPTVAGQGITVEPWILDYSGDLYGREISLEFYRFLRSEQKFPTLEDLKNRIHEDARETRAYLDSL